MSDNKPQPIIKKVKKVVGGGAHGGTWKIAYADFVTAMMAFFLVMWLINATTESKRKGIADYFDPISAGTKKGGDIGVMGGMSIKSPTGGLEDASAKIHIQPTTPLKKGAGGNNAGPEKKKSLQKNNRPPPPSYKSAEQEKKSLQTVEKEIQKSMQQSFTLKELKNNVILKQTPKGLEIELIDQKNHSMFPNGSSDMYKQTHDILEIVASTIQNIPNPIDVTGHTDAIPYPPDATFGNWELSADRANAARKALSESGIPDNRFDAVVGKADHDLYDPAHPDAPQNRRISILLLRQFPDQPPPSADAAAPAAASTTPTAAQPSPPSSQQDGTPPPAPLKDSSMSQISLGG